ADGALISGGQRKVDRRQDTGALREFHCARYPTITAGIGQFAVIQSVAPSLGIDVRPISVHGDIERIIAGFARVPNGGLVVSASAAAATESRRELITTLAARHKLPGIANTKIYVTRGGPLSRSPSFSGPFL